MAGVIFTMPGRVRVALYQLTMVMAMHSTSGGTNAKSVRVGGDLGWTNVNPTTGRAPDYASWAASQTLAPNDTLGESTPNFSQTRLLPEVTNLLHQMIS